MVYDCEVTHWYVADSRGSVEAGESLCAGRTCVSGRVLESGGRQAPELYMWKPSA